MKFLRTLSKLFVFLLAIAAVLAALIFVPAIQTWIAGRAIDKRPSLHLSVGSVWARFGKLDTEDIRVELPGAVLTIPSLEAQLPVTAAARTGIFSFQKIFAKGWTLDFRNLPKEAPPSPDAVSSPPDTSSTTVKLADQSPPAPSPGSADPAARVFTGLLTGWKLPADFSADEVDLEGDILLPGGTEAEPTRIHVTIKGTDIGAGRKSALIMTADGNYPTVQLPGFSYSANGELVIAMDSPRTFSQAEWRPAVALSRGPLSKDIGVALDLGVTRQSTEETYSVDLAKDNRHIATVLAHFRDGKGPFVGTWKSDLRQTDLAPFFPSTPLPPISGAGAGEFDADVGLARLHLLGDLRVGADGAGMLATILSTLRSESVDTRFDFVRTRDALHVNRLGAILGDARHRISLASLQPFEFDPVTGAITLTAPDRDWVDGSVAGLPLSWLSALTPHWNVTGGDLNGEFTIKTTDHGFSLRGKEPITVTHVSLKRNGSAFVEGLDVSLSLLGEANAKGWQVHGAPTVVTSAGKTVATLELTVSRPTDPKYPLTLETKGNADLTTLSSQPGFSDLRQLSIGELSGDVITSIGDWIHVAGDVKCVQPESKETIAAKLNADVRSDRSVVFRVPITLAKGAAGNELTTEGTWLPGKYGREITVSLSSKDLDIESLRIFGPLLLRFARPASGAPLLDTGSLIPPEGPPPTAAPDTVPFWGDIVGRVTVNFERLKFADASLQDVHGTLVFDPKSVRLEHALYQLSNHLAQADAAISFDRQGAVRYAVTGTFDDGEIDAEPLFGPAPAGEDPPFHGRFTVASSLKGNGNNLEELLSRTQQQFLLKSTSGIVRILKTHVTGVTHEKESKLGDAADVMGGLVGKVAGVKPNSIRKGQNKLNRTTENVLNFSYDCGEIGYSDLTLTATRGSDGAFHLLDLSMIAADEHITALGEVAYVKGASLLKEPLSLTFRLGVKGQTAELLAGTGLLSTEKDSLGYTLFQKPVHLGGTLQHVDVTEWHDLLFEAAAAPAEPKKK